MRRHHVSVQWKTWTTSRVSRFRLEQIHPSFVRRLGERFHLKSILELLHDTCVVQ